MKITITNAYIYYRIYIITGDEHYRDYAEFIHNNSRNSSLTSD